MTDRKVVWVTGGGTGIGLETARRLAAAGHALVVSGRRQAELDAAVASLREAGADAQAVALDVSDAEAVARAFAQIVDRHGTVDALVCSAGTNVPNRYWDTLTPEAFAKVTAINLNGVAYCVSAVLPAMRKAGRGSIVVVSSWAGWRFTPFTGAAYGATKTGLAPLVETINDQEGRHGVRATLVCPGEVATPILKTRPVPPSELELSRMLKPQDVASAIVFALDAPPHVCLNELVISPVWNRMYIGGEDIRRR
ncbi:MAG TPA: SDR family oxidoreductase [Burkholderiaceae bacterium]|nr:SDR family oxidoreductase [Burkholderiaceae bacterium]